MPLINTVEEFNSQVFPEGATKATAYAWPGGYPVFYLASDCETMCAECVTKERELITASIADKSNESWRVVGYDINWEDENMVCANCNKPIECAYPSDNEGGN